MLRPVSAVPDFVVGLAAHGDRAALHAGDETLTYRDLARRVRDRAAALGPRRRLVAVVAEPTVDSVVDYLASMAAGSVTLLTSASAVDAAVETYDVDVVLRPGSDLVRREETNHVLHPELVLLLSTSGTTGSPRLVRLSGTNVQSNAESIAAYLSLGPDDVAVTSLPLHYCYGLSVLHSHLLCGAAVVLTSLSVVAPCFWDLVERHGVTSLAGVPHTFDLLDRSGFADRDVTSLRRLTQAGGRMAPAQVARYAGLGRERGFDLVVMYGQTEATARMAYLPPHLAADHPDAIGVAVPGGRLWIEPSPDAPDGEGELVYAGPNVMLGYAESAADLGRPRDIDVLRTGDLARRSDEGLFRITGRTARFAKLFGLRVDLDGVERRLADAGVDAALAADDRRLVVACSSPELAEVARAVVRDACGLPGHVVEIHVVSELPRLASGKVDYGALLDLVAGPLEATSVEHLYRTVLGRDVGPDDTFVSLGGDSLSFVEVSVHLGRLLADLPADWHVRSVADLDRAPRRLPGRRRWAVVETAVALRAAAILAVVGSHANVFTITGGAHLLLFLVGHSVGRFLLARGRGRRERATGLVRAALRVAVPSVLWIGGVALATQAYPWSTALLVNGIAGPSSWTEPEWHFWFVEVVVHTTLVLALAMAVPIVDRADRRWPFWLPVALSVVGLLTRYDVVSLRPGDDVHRASVVFWLVALGWAASRVERPAHRVVVSVLLAVTVPGLFAADARNAVVLAGCLVAVWIPTLRVPRAAAWVVAPLAASSMYVYLTHWQVYPHFEDRAPVLAWMLSMGVGLVVWRIASRVEGALARALAGASVEHGRPRRGVDDDTYRPADAEVEVAAASGPQSTP